MPQTFLRQIADKAHRIGDNRFGYPGKRSRALFVFQRSKKLYPSTNTELLVRAIEQRGFAGISIADDGNDRQL